MGAGLAAARAGEAQPKPPAAQEDAASGAAAELPVDPDCLAVTQASAATYTIANAACPELSIMAAIELASDGSQARCFVKKIRTQISIASEGSAPVINYQCIEGAPGCSPEIVHGMFPECHAG
ncbi:hypothetical protein [Hyphomicrobium sp.]|jgi:hypothetical protein|uniref:hypothetical protein n=1 Tax=Hyphomicrobium sp. TaxID=82 RepID=UPI002FE26AC5